MSRIRLFASPLVLAMALAACAPDPETRFADAQEAFAANDFRGARVSLIAGLKDQPGNHEMRLLLAQAQIALGDGEGAATSLGTLPEAMRNDPRFQALTIESDFLRGRYRQGLQLAEAYRGAGRELLLARAYLLLGDPEAASRSFSAGLERGDASADHLAEYALFTLREGDVERATELLEAAKKADPTSLVVLLANGEIASQAGRDEVALNAFREASERYPNSLDAKLAYASALGANGHVKEAEAIAAKIVEGGTTADDATLILARAAAQKGDWPKVRRLLQRYSGSGPIDHRLLYANALLEEGMMPLAIAELSPLRTRSPENPAVRRLHAEALVRAGDLASALEDLEWLASRPDSTELDRQRWSMAQRDAGIGQ